MAERRGDHMAITKLTTSTDIIQALSDLPNSSDGLSAAQLKAKFDEAAGIIKTYINDTLVTELESTTDGSSGADQIGATAISDLTGATVQALLESLRNSLKSTTDGSSGADFVNATTISGLSGSTVQGLIESLKTFVDTHKTSGDHDGRYFTETELSSTTGTTGASRIGSTVDGLTGSTVQTILESIKSALGALEAQLPDGQDIAYTTTRIDTIETNLSSQAEQETTLTHGTQVITSDIPGPLKLEFYGNTLVNLLGEIGNFETDSNSDGVADGISKATEGSYSLETTDVYYGTKAQRISSLSSDTNYLSRRIDIPINYESGKYYIALVDVVTDGTSKQRIRVDYDSTNQFSTESTDNGMVYVKFNPSTTGSGYIRCYNYNNVGVEGWVQFDGARLIEVSSTVYNEIGVLSDAEIEKRFPYVDSVKHAQNVYAKVSGTNLFDGQIELGSIDPNNGTLVGSTTVVRSVNYTEVLSGQSYVLSKSTTDTGIYRYFYYDKDKNFISSSTTNLDSPITAPSNAEYFKFHYDTQGDTTVKFQLELGSSVTPYTDYNPSYLYLPTKLASDVEGNKKDISYKVESTWYVEHKFEKDYVLDGSLDWTFAQDYTGHKRVYATITNTDDYYEHYVVKYDGSILEQVGGSAAITSSDQSYIYLSRIYTTIEDTDSGFGESYTPTQAEIQANFWGWRMCDGTFGTPYNGTGTKTWYPKGDSDLTNAVTTVPSSESPTITDGTIDYYYLTYELATPVTEVIAHEGDLSIQGDAQVTIGSGFSYTTDTDGSKTYTLTADADRYAETTNVLDVTAYYSKTLHSAVKQLTAEHTDTATQVSINLNQLIDHEARLDALGG